MVNGVERIDEVVGWTRHGKGGAYYYSGGTVAREQYGKTYITPM